MGAMPAGFAGGGQELPVKEDGPSLRHRSGRLPMQANFEDARPLPPGVPREIIVRKAIELIRQTPTHVLEAYLPVLAQHATPPCLVLRLPQWRRRHGQVIGPAPGAL